MIITLIRHLPTDWNKKKWLQGRRDIGISNLTEDIQTGITSNQQLLKKLSPFDLVIASTLKRTHQTAQLYGYRFESDRLLDELDFGPFEGLPKEKLYEKYGDCWFNTPKDLVLGESLRNLEKRVILFLDKYKESRNILLFGHGSWIRALISFHNYGHINNMNKTTVGNNQCITLSLNSCDMEGEN
jgi:broad specificity phosphatase PhoE